MKEMVPEGFRNPGCEFRGAPFWAWNGKLEPEELRRQIRLMKDMGLGGFFMHSRVGLDTAYLSPEWFDCVNACIDEAKKLGMNAWLYDEDRWPSGAAGGLVTKNPQYRERRIIMEELKSAKHFKKVEGTLAVFAAARSGDETYISYRALSTGNLKISRTETLLHFHVKLSDSSSWYNGQTYLDTMDTEAVRKFIVTTHEKYRSECGSDFGGMVPGIFTDEPNHPAFCADAGEGRTSAPWSRKLREVFTGKYGYDIVKHLPEIFLDFTAIPVSKARYHFHDCVTSMFVEAFARQIGEWCEENNMMHTGHVLSEETLASQTSHVGSCMRFYEYMQAPGMDILTEHRREYLTAKQVSSVARQFGRKWRLTETYGCTGWDFPFKGHKAIGDWQAALGINLRCQHLSWYTMLGQAKRDYPAGIFYQSPWYRQYSKVEDYFARINAVMSQGEEVRDLLVLHPNESMWLLCSKKTARKEAEIRSYEENFVGLQDHLLESNVDFDYTDEEILSRHAEVVKAKGIPGIRVKRAVYKAVIVPSFITIRSTTLKILEDFRDAGGLVVFVSNIPEHVDAEKSTKAVDFAKKCILSKGGGKSSNPKVELCRRVSIREAGGQEVPNTLYQLREDQDNFYLFVCNTGFTGKARKDFKVVECPPVSERIITYPNVEISGFAGCKGIAIELDPDTGETFLADYSRADGKVTIKTSLHELGSRLFVVSKKIVTPPSGLKKRPELRISQIVPQSRIEWDIKLSEDNVLVLDRPGYSIDGGEWRKGEILEVDHVARGALGIRTRGGQMVQPWARERKKEPNSVTLQLRYEFESGIIPSGPVYLAMEAPGLFKVDVNGCPLNTDDDCGWWCDRSLKKLQIPFGALRKGKNMVSMACRFNENHPGLEIVYLLGSFGVRLDDNKHIEMTALPNSIRFGDWRPQGLPFYSGSIAYHSKNKAVFKNKQRVFATVENYRGTAVRVLVDGVEAGIIAWEPNEVEITGLIKSGKPFDICYELISHRRNSHGPLHNKETWPRWTGPGQYEQAQEDFNLVPCGILSNPEILVKS